MNYRETFQCQDCDDHEPCAAHSAFLDKHEEPDADRQYKEARDEDL